MSIIEKSQLVEKSLNERGLHIHKYNFVPLYTLFKIYQTVGKADKANMIAHEIADKPSKVYSPKVVMIKDEISKYLFENVTE